MFIDLILIFVVKSLQQILRVLPEGLQLSIGKSLGRLAFTVLRTRRNVAFSNIRRVFSHLNDSDIERIARSNFTKSLGINVIEFLLIPFLNMDTLAQRFSIEGREIIDASLEQGRGVIALGFHFGNWEVTGVISRLLGRDIIALARPLKKQVRLNSFVNSLRMSTGLTIIVNENTSRTVLRLLKENKIVALLADQREKRSRGVYVELFGTKVPTSRGVAMIGMKTGATVIPIYAIRKGFLRYTFVCAAPIEMERKGNVEELVAQNTRKVNQFLESLILKYPDEWFWVHRRWGRKERNGHRSHRHKHQ